MERNTKTTVNELLPGDRFYKCNDKNKKVFEKIEHQTKRTHYQTYKHWCLEAAVADGNMHSSAKYEWATAIKADTEVIFLKHKNQ